MAALAAISVRRDRAWDALFRAQDCMRDCGKDLPKCSEPRELLEHEYPACPVALTSAPRWREILRLHGAAQSSPLADWPDGWAAWVSDGVVAVDAAIRSRQARELEDARRRP